MDLPGQLGLSEMISAMAASQPIYAVQAAPAHYPLEALAQYSHPQYHMQQGYTMAPVSAAAAIHSGVLTRAHPGLHQQPQHPGIRGPHHPLPGPPGLGPGHRPDTNGAGYPHPHHMLADPGHHNPHAPIQQQQQQPPPQHQHPPQHMMLEDIPPGVGSGSDSRAGRGPSHSEGGGSNSGGHSSSSRGEGGGSGSDGGGGRESIDDHSDRDRRSDRSNRDHRRDRDHKDRRERSSGMDRREYRDRGDRNRDRDYDRFDRRSRERGEFDRDRDRDRDRGSERGGGSDRGSERGDRSDRERDRDRDRRDRYRGDDERGGSSPRLRSDRHMDHYDRMERDNFDDDRPVDYRNMPPNNTIMVRGLAQHITENDIRDDILSCDLTPKDIRLVRRKESGASRGFAFVEFTTVHDATRWMEAKQGVLLLNDAYRATLQYSIPKDAGDRQAKATQDWICVRCGVHNFKRRDSCFKCTAPRHESESGDDGSEEACNYPTYKLVLRGLDVLTTEEGVLQAIQHASTDISIKSVRIGRDPLTNLSRGVCYVELESVYNAMTLFNKLMSRPPTIDGKAINISYCKLSNNQANASMGKPNNSDYWGGNAPNPPTPAQSQMPQTTDVARLAEYSASLYAQNEEEHASYLQYYTQYYTQQQEQEQATTQSDSVNAAAAVAQSALQALHHKSAAAAGATQQPTAAAAAAAAAAPAAHSATPAPAAVIATPTGTSSDFPQYPTPDVSTYQYDETSGYYYDSSTGLYYDANTSYYYNSESGQFLYWDTERSTYLPAPSSEDDQANKQLPGEKKEKDKDKQEKVKVAKKIAKDMERWAKAQNKRNESGKVAGEQPVGGPAGEGGAGSGAADAAFAVLLERRNPGSGVSPSATLSPAHLPEKSLTLKMQLKKEPQTPSHGGLKKSGLVAAYGDEGSDSGEDENGAAATAASSGPASNKSTPDEDLVDLSKMACLLCKRQFANKDGLNRHVQLSNLHKTNLEALRGGSSSSGGAGGGGGGGGTGSGGDDDDGMGGQYRDRALERRKKYGMPNRPPPNKLKEKYMSVREEISSVNYEEPTKRGIGADNIGNKMLKMMGWNDGQGLGKSNQGRTQIIEAERRVSSVGLGVQGSNYTVVGDSYKDCVKKMMYHRYQELDAQEKDPVG